MRKRFGEVRKGVCGKKLNVCVENTAESRNVAQKSRPVGEEWRITMRSPEK